MPGHVRARGKRQDGSTIWQARWRPADDASDPDRLLFVTPRGYPVRHNLFYKRVFAPAVAHTLPRRLHGLRFHDLRHTCAALSLAASPNLTLVKERLGHENIATTIDLYGKRVPSVDAALADAVGASIFSSAEETVTPLRLVRAPE
jgi:integrase